ncbi:MAG: hypothetical protein ACFB3T_11325 [Geminicoccaceae bacterium]
MTLAQLAAQVAVDRDGAYNRWLREQAPVDAAILLAIRAGVINLPQFDRLMDMDWREDFAVFVSPNDPLVRSAAEMVDVPPGCFIAFISVDQPELGETRARRYLEHAMISIGDGEATGAHNADVGLPSEGRAYQRISLAEHLNWLPAEVTNGFDMINGLPIGTDQARPLRIRYRDPQAPPAAVPWLAPPAPGTWGNPQVDAALADRIADAAAATLQGYDVEAARANGSGRQNDPVFRPKFRFRIDHDDYEAFFNSPNGLRGHYFAGADQGDAYTRDLIQRILDRLDMSLLLSRARPRFHEPLTALQNAFLRGKIWTVEPPVVTGSVDWDLSKRTDHHPVPIAPNTRWRTSPEWRNQRNRLAFELETGAQFAWHATDDGQDALTQIMEKFSIGSEETDSGASYFFTRRVPVDLGGGAPAQPAIDLATAANIDVKGGWTRPDGSDGAFVPKQKYFRGHQIKWFGFS